MKKAIIAAGASAVLAAMPVVGVFATSHINGSPLVDQLNVNLSEICTLSRKVTTSGEEPNITSDAGHPAAANTGGATIATGAGITNGWVTDSNNTNQDNFSATIVAGNEYDAIASSAFNVTCNDVNGGYKVTVTPTGFTGVNNAATWSYNANGYATSGSSWYLSSNASADNKDIANGIVWQRAADTNNTFTSADFTITYNVKAVSTQEQGSYTATATYTLADIGA